VKEGIKKIINFFDDDIPYHAASLSFFTIFSILPLLALLIVVISKLPAYQDYSDLITQYILDFINPTHSQTLANSLTHFLSNADKLGSIGLFYLLFVFTMFFRDYEYIVNKIYNTKARAVYKVFILYFSFLIMIPVIFISFVFISTFMDITLSQNFFIFLFIWLVFIILFLLSANKKISLKAAAISSFITLSVLSITKSLFGYYVTVNTTYATIYGSFSVVLFFFLWIYISWNIYLYGTKICSLINKDISIDEE
jgi:membrane protein